ncbi:DUF4145 domain-containing protein [Priestia endophytica]|uniref:DUF4145 domain-containing protein n=1 Tax=Priestia endophytica TaxID=135735 RepID=A0AAX1Q7U7_9BACI|nr:DUF4145 domain-containing protein [Priestia endophytica]RAS75235.1 hypothetical protein A3864_16345 [Priestia endophytica]
MKSITLDIKTENVEVYANSDTASICEYEWHIHIPILSAFSVEYFVLQYGPFSSFSESTSLSIQGNKIIAESQFASLEELGQECVAILHHHGIRDYSLLFPWVENVDLRERIGRFYEEAEKSFEQGSWLSFALMCGGVFEGMLYAKLNMPQNNNFYAMIEAAYEDREIINLQQKGIMDDVRNARNLIHASRFKQDYMSRKKAMDIMTTMSKLIKRFSY